MTIAGDDLTFDFTGTAEQIKAPINVPWPCTKAAVFFAVKALMGDDIPANEGINRAVKIIAPEGSIVNPTEPSPIGAQIDCQQRIPDAIFGALASVRAMAPAPQQSLRAKATSARTVYLSSMRSSPEEAVPAARRTVFPACR